ncbi:molybdate transport system substrate-binding protein [Pedobacter psychrotolerans]|uniref:Molybdate ABC transporter substrate-binding protein n=1 Tax=Pedobacter psychrotolerans TaxID=1843235 RepID=A0A4R2HDJ7_9SPHI|nr:molybdate ABC transporter substrate-binding protein [Pedobacter psychrotolerans]TCO25471.1 molybdate transport system substrate-binding protein [Pedobacter psychrotolerans]GGE45169.1 molybdate ABC transporter substrate-binding protein [Pedobacter psychrotolerans]
MKKNPAFRILILTLLFCLAGNAQLSAQVLRIAVAANAQQLIKRLQKDFERKTGIKSEAIVGASGKLTTQIMNGAPYDIFLSADTEFPEQLYAKQLGLLKPKIYALGSLIICGKTNHDLKNWPKLLLGSKTGRIAVANPKTAPYGKAAKEALEYYQLKDKVSSNLVYAENISQVNTYIQTRAVELGFTTESFLYEHSDKSKLKWARVDPESYGKIEQGAILLTYAKKGKLKEATKFFDYLSSASAQQIISKSGYHLPVVKKS